MCFSFCNFIFVIRGVIMNFGMQTTKGYLSEETRIMLVFTERACSK